MAIEYSIKTEGDLLLVEAWGADDDLEDVVNYGQAVIGAALEHTCFRILCDETRLEYRIGTLDTFEAARVIAAAAPHIARVAIVCKPEYAKDAAFWETVAVNRGLSVRVFRDLAEARRWLDEPGDA